MTHHTPFTTYHGGKYSNGLNGSSTFSVEGSACSFAGLKRARLWGRVLLMTHCGEFVGCNGRPSLCRTDVRSETRLSLLLNAARLSRGRRGLFHDCDEGGGLCQIDEGDAEPVLRREEPELESDLRRESLLLHFLECRVRGKNLIWCDGLLLRGDMLEPARIYVRLDSIVGSEVDVGDSHLRRDAVFCPRYERLSMWWWL
ncbi:hypothetical protein IAQ61_009175 [Plenodomus lingam]|uniref:uncharacterized protein n=1 Tax=Leptosphaeria maculans TaxID=5022 RepID=UPI0033340AC8|nr:hypothetical protein IAQ61_009175 [Plenodomus lingam]